MHSIFLLVERQIFAMDFMGLRIDTSESFVVVIVADYDFAVFRYPDIGLYHVSTSLYCGLEGSKSVLWALH
jgi:hypothetical protein